MKKRIAKKHAKSNIYNINEIVNIYGKFHDLIPQIMEGQRVMGKIISMEYSTGIDAVTKGQGCMKQLATIVESIATITGNDAIKSPFTTAITSIKDTFEELSMVSTNLHEIWQIMDKMNHPQLYCNDDRDYSLDWIDLVIEDFDRLLMMIKKVVKVVDSVDDTCSDDNGGTLPRNDGNDLNQTDLDEFNKLISLFRNKEISDILIRLGNPRKYLLEDDGLGWTELAAADYKRIISLIGSNTENDDYHFGQPDDLVHRVYEVYNLITKIAHPNNRTNNMRSFMDWVPHIIELMHRLMTAVKNITGDNTMGTELTQRLDMLNHLNEMVPHLTKLYMAIYNFKNNDSKIDFSCFSEKYEDYREGIETINGLYKSLRWIPAIHVNYYKSISFMRLIMEKESIIDSSESDRIPGILSDSEAIKCLWDIVNSLESYVNLYDSFRDGCEIIGKIYPRTIDNSEYFVVRDIVDDITRMSQEQITEKICDYKRMVKVVRDITGDNTWMSNELSSLIRFYDHIKAIYKVAMSFGIRLSVETDEDDG